MIITEVIFIVCCVIYAAKILLIRIASSKSRKQQVKTIELNTNSSSTNTLSTLSTNNSINLPEVSIIVPANTNNNLNINTLSTNNSANNSNTNTLSTNNSANNSNTNTLSTNNSINLPEVSIIVPARNEENNISSCLNSLLASNYPLDKFEIVVVNDRSSDNTAEIVSNYAQKHSNIKLVNVTEETRHKNLQGKPGALQAGIDATSYDIFMMTDADCIVDKNWILAIVSHFLVSENVGMVCSYTNISGNRIFETFQDAEWTYMNTYAAAGIGMGSVLGCFGNNLSITRAAYQKIGGYANLSFSVTEDYILLKAVFDAGYKIYYICDSNANVETLPAATFKEYLTQHKRWAVGGTALGWKAFMFVFSSACSTIAFAISIIDMNPVMLFINISLRILGDILVLFPVFDCLDRKHLKRNIPLYVLMFSTVELILPFIIINKKVVWKGQVFTSKKK